MNGDEDRRPLDEIATMNRREWEKNVSAGDRNTLPFLDLNVVEFQEYVGGQRKALPEPYCDQLPDSIFMENLTGKNVLCLASGGGQQSAVFGLLGARVTVLDLTAGQLAADREAAEHYGYKVTTVQGDMRDLSAFADASFDYVFHPISIVFVPEVREVYREVARVLRTAGLYWVSHCNPATSPTTFDGPDNGWDGVGYRIAEPYCGGPVRLREDGSESMTEGEMTGEFRHLYRDIFNGLVESGLAIEGVWEAPCHLQHDAEAEPGSDAHWRSRIAEYFSILARRSPRRPSAKGRQSDPQPDGSSRQRAEKLPDSVEIREVGPEALERYGQTPIRFMVESILQVEEIDGGLGGVSLREEAVEEPYLKDYDEYDEEGPTRWPKRFDVSNWAFFMACERDQPLGGAVVAYRTPDVHMLDGRTDLAVLWDLRVEPDHRRRGIGSGLFQQVVEWAVRRDCTQLKIETQNVNVAACRFYAAQGCYLGGHQRHVYPDPVSDEVMLLWYLDLPGEGIVD